MRWDGGELVGDSGARYSRPADFAAAEGVLLPFPGRAPEELAGMLTPAARAAADLFFSGSGGLTVLRGELEDFIVFARLDGAIWRVGAVASGETTLTVRFEDLWERLPVERRAVCYRVEVSRDPTRADAPCADGLVRQTLADIAPDARLTLDLAPAGGFRLDFIPMLRGGV